MNKYFFLLCLIAFSFYNCKKNNNTTQQQTAQTVNIPADFQAFYEKFHKDSLYQINHITFPLHGFPDKVDSMTVKRDDWIWEAGGWILHRSFAGNAEFKQELTAFDENMIVETVYQLNTPYSMERRFAKLNGEWFLIYYVGMNAIEHKR